MADFIHGEGTFIPTSFTWELSDLKAEVTSKDFRELLVRLRQNINLIQSILNIKDTGLYIKNEYVNGQLYFPNSMTTDVTQTNEQRQVFRKVIEFGALPNAAPKSIAHLIPITAAYSFTKIYGAATNPTAVTFLPIPNSTIDIIVDATNVTITTAADLTGYTTTYVVLEYLKH